MDNESNLKIIHLDIHAFSANSLDFKAHLATLKVKFDVVCLTETWLVVVDENINLFPGYTSYHSIQERKLGGGVSVFINNKFWSNQFYDHSFTYDFFLSISVNVKKGVCKGFVLASYYRPPVHSMYENFINLFSSQMNTLNRCSFNFIICGDFNFDFFKNDSDLKVTSRVLTF